MSLQAQIDSIAQQLMTLTDCENVKGSGWLDKLLQHALQDEGFRIQALRFVDVLPTLKDDLSLAEHLKEYFSNKNLPPFAEWLLSCSDSTWALRVASPTVRYISKGLAAKFMGGSQLNQALKNIIRLRQDSMNVTLDLLGEATISEFEADEYQNSYLNMISVLSAAVSGWQVNELLDENHGRVSPGLNISIKLSSLYSQINSASPEKSIDNIKQRLRPILRQAKDNQVFVTFDMEKFQFKNIVLQAFKSILMEDYFKDWPDVGIALQAYLKETYDDIQKIINWVKQRNCPVTVRLVRGAYWDYETVIARQNNWPTPVWLNKCDTDANYEKCLCLLFDNYPVIETAVAGHNYRSIAYAMALANDKNIRKDQFEFQMLYGMADDIKQALVSMGYRLRIYMPYGEALPGMAYLVRRLLENSSSQKMMGFSSRTNKDINFSRPEFSEIENKIENNKNVFKNSAVTRFTNKKDSNEFKLAINETEKNLAQDYKLIIHGEKIIGDECIESSCPSRPDLVIGYVSMASKSQADAALESSLDAKKSWNNLSASNRADYLKRVANLLAERRPEFSSWLVFEAGKNWHEADADVCEAIDFLNYYAQQAEKIALPLINEVSGEHNQYYYHAKGVALIISPWNFPLAILTGMLAAAIVTGNTAILKPSSLTPVVAARFMDLFLEAGLPAGVINFLPGSGKNIAEYLARKSEINVIAFTGSQQVGMHLINIASKLNPGQQHVKQVIAEMGGKNTLIIDQDADLDEAVVGTLQSAFGFQGQKCSAASRVVVVKQIHDRFVERLIQATKSLTMGDPCHAFNFMGPVIDEVAYQRILHSISQGEKTAELVLFDQIKPLCRSEDEGFFIKPAIFTGVDASSPIAQEEIFGPVLSILQADDFSQAIELANNTRYALTGGVYSRQPSHLQMARERFQVGNLYLNRGITGALVSRQPFGGYKMSGQGNKAGGDKYLLQFMNASCVTENTLRQGFAPKPCDETKV